MVVTFALRILGFKPALDANWNNISLVGVKLSEDSTWRIGPNYTFLFCFVLFLVKMSTYDENENESKFLRKAKENPFVPVGEYWMPLSVAHSLHFLL